MRVFIEPLRSGSGLSRDPGRRGLRTAVLVAALTVLASAAVVGPAGAASSDPVPRLAAPPVALLGMQQAQLNAGDGAAGDQFGEAVAVDGDTAIVGVPYRDSGGQMSVGAAYIFVRSQGVWTLQQTLTAADGAADDYFGWSVDVSGETVLIGAKGDDSSSPTVSGAGSVYFFKRSGSTWSLQEKVPCPVPVEEASFGYSVALEDDLALVGCPYGQAALLRPHDGVVWPLKRSGADWSSQQPFVAADGAGDEDFFGGSVAFSGATAVVGAPRDDIDVVSNAGSAYIFTSALDVWTQQAKLTAPASERSDQDQFGHAVAASGDTVLVGAHSATIDGVDDSGATYVFTRSGTSWPQQARLVPLAAGKYEYSGIAVSLDGDTALVGAYSDGTETSYGCGSAAVFTRSGGAWTCDDVLFADEPKGGAQFGWAVAVSGDTAVIGAHQEDVGDNVDQGAAYAFLLDGANPMTTAAVTPDANAAGWRRVAVTVTLSASDVGSGLATTEYRRQGASVWTPYVSPFMAGDQGVSTWEYRSTDTVGHVETAGAVTHQIDSGRPVTTGYAAAVKKGKTVRLRFKVTDALPGCAEATVVIKVYKGKVLKKRLTAGVRACNVKTSKTWRCGLARGRYTFRIYATDIAGNVQSKAGSARLTVK